MSPELGRPFLLLGITLPGAGRGFIAPDASAVFGRHEATVAGHEVGPKLPVQFVDSDVESPGREPGADGLIYHGGEDR